MDTVSLKTGGRRKHRKKGFFVAISKTAMHKKPLGKISHCITSVCNHPKAQIFEQYRFMLSMKKVKNPITGDCFLIG